MTVTYQDEVLAIRRRMNDIPVEDYLAAAITGTTDSTMSPQEITRFRVGQLWEFSDGTSTNAEVVLVRSVSDTVEIQRGYQSTAAVHAAGTVMYLEPRFSYASVVAAMQDVLLVEMYSAGVYDLQYHQILSSAVTDSYGAPTSSCEQFLEVYQIPHPGDNKSFVDWQRTLRKVDTSLFPTGKMVEIHGNWGIAGTDYYYVTCAHKLTIGSLTDAQATAMRARVAAKLLTWENAERLSGNPSQTDQNIGSLDRVKLAQQYNAEWKQLIDEQADDLKRLFKPKRVFLRSS